MLWEDDFSGPSLDASKWEAQLGDGSAYSIPGWGNGELVRRNGGGGPGGRGQHLGGKEERGSFVGEEQEEGDERAPRRGLLRPARRHE